ncbi:hypothetical protein [Kitasatospora sp. LaBMicrA B282]|uniref:hypothetical protein n=1 Tax=Kitasatospora sp. LaBMicrA B282 TaxID=3420949 RepID=UPI003D0E71CA
MRLRLAALLTAALVLAGVSTPAFAASGSAPGAPAASGFVPVSPTRVLDTRNSAANCAENSTLQSDSFSDVELALCAGHMPPTPVWSVPAGATAVVVNVTATDASADTYLSIGAPGTFTQASPPAFSTLNVSPGHDVANLVTVALGPDADGENAGVAGLTLYNHAGSVDVVLDVLGYYMPPSQTTTTYRYTPIQPARALDTRQQQVPLGPGAQQVVQVNGLPGIPADAAALVVTLTATDATTRSFLTVTPVGVQQTTSTVNYEPGKDVSNQAIVPVSGSGSSIAVDNHAGSVDAVLDVVGYYSTDGQALFTPVPPSRILDTRTGSGPLGANAALPLAVAGHGGVPTGAIGAVLNLTATQETQPSHLIVWPAGQPVPGTSSLNTNPSTDIAEHVQTRLGSAGAVDIYNHAGSTQVIADVYGYFTAP